MASSRRHANYLWGKVRHDWEADHAKGYATKPTQASKKKG